MVTDIMSVNFNRKYNSLVVICLLFSLLSSGIGVTEIRCPAGHYGDDCSACSAGCVDGCNESTGACGCKTWWIGPRCETEIVSRKLPGKQLSLVATTDSSVTIRWQKIEGVPSDLAEHYLYVIQYWERAPESWREWLTRPRHDPSLDQYQELTLTGLMYDTEYQVQVKSYRVRGNLRQGTGGTRVVDFTTKCQAPEKPRNLKVVVGKSSGEKLNLDLSWEAPQVFSDCRGIVNIRVQYRFRSSSENDWVEPSVLTAQLTSATLSGLESNNYVIRVTFRNDGGLTSYAETATDHDTLCNQCSDEDCKTNEPCENCRAGFKPPECRDCCDAGDYGASCSEECSEGCKDICDHVFGHCICHHWWKGAKCTTEIRELRLSRDEPRFRSVDESRAVIRWKKIPSVNSFLSDHYQYVIEYKEETSSSWVEWQTRYSHDPSPDQYREATLTGLMYNTVYDVRVKSYRVRGGDREETGITRSNQFRTKCTTPSKPRDVTAFKKQGNENTLFITWKKAAISGCNKISYQILYRLRSASVGNWTVVDSNSSTSHVLRLNSGTYDIRVRVTNDGNGSYGYSNFAEVLYNDQENRGRRGSSIGLIVGIVIPCVVAVAALTVTSGVLYYRVQQLKKKTKTMQNTVTMYQIGVSISEDTAVNPNLAQRSEDGYEEPISHQRAIECDGRVDNPELEHMPPGYIIPGDPREVSGHYEDVGTTPPEQARMSGDYEKPAVYENVDGSAPIHVYDQLQNE